MDVSGRILASLDAGYPCRHDEDLHFSCVVGEGKLMEHFAATLWMSFTVSLRNPCHEQIENQDEESEKH